MKISIGSLITEAINKSAKDFLLNELENIKQNALEAGGNREDVKNVQDLYLLSLDVACKSLLKERQVLNHENRKDDCKRFN